MGRAAILMALGMLAAGAPPPVLTRPSSIPEPPLPALPPDPIQAAIVDRRTEKQKRRAERNLRDVKAGGWKR